MIHGLTQNVTYWEPSGSNRYGGNSYNRVVLKGRWEDKDEVIVSKTGQESVSKAKVFLSQDVAEDGYLFAGTSAGADPTQVVGAQEIMSKTSIASIRNITRLFVAYVG